VTILSWILKAYADELSSAGLKHDRKLRGEFLRWEKQQLRST
jgi:hypothetical protein